MDRQTRSTPAPEARRKKRRALLSAAAVLTALGAFALPTAQAEEPVRSAAAGPGAMEEVWSTDFEGEAGSLPDSGDWIIDTGTGYDGGPPNWGTGEVQTYTDAPENIQLDGEGHLKITALKDGDTWTSGRIETQRTDFEAPEDGVLRISADIQMPDVTGDAALGYWPAFWTLGDEYRGNYWNWPGVGEFDIMENVNGINSVWGVLHCGEDPGGPCNETEGLGDSTECVGSPCQGNFHEYALEVDRGAGELRWYVDGEQFHSVTAAQIGEEAWENATGHGHFVLLNLAMGGAFPDGVEGSPTPTDATEPGHSMLVDRVTVETGGGDA
ncbi:glycoside hydrolase family 16 protein [Streptomyces sulphureus]|uniref:glycoside hydrolase family 16 protein n=1 Tax=Streptomyces sulphureus TaxID=47758 RepID=UPI000362D910|nr:glycoside hydrolase family 16 protein [Streptomyces sulphureus]